MNNPNPLPRKNKPNKATIEKAIIAERQLVATKARQQLLAKEVLQQYMNLFSGLAAAYQITPAHVSRQINAHADEKKFDKYAMLACKCAADLAPYQSPTMRSVVIAQDVVENTSTSLFEARQKLKAVLGVLEPELVGEATEIVEDDIPEFVGSNGGGNGGT